MNLDFTHKKFYQLCRAITENYPTMTIAEYLMKLEDNQLHNKFVIMRHDIDRKPERALRVAMIEQELGLKATYYFRSNDIVHNYEIIKKINEMGHEVGYHYEVFGKAKGNYEKAIELFECDLKELRKICDIKTICMHGNPLSKYYEHDLWKLYDFNDYGIIGEAYLSVCMDTNINYFTDTGRAWNSKNNMRDFIPNKKESIVNIKTTDNMIELINTSKINNIYILTHPERWSSNNKEWILSCLTDSIFNLGKKAFGRR